MDDAITELLPKSTGPAEKQPVQNFKVMQLVDGNIKSVTKVLQGVEVPLELDTNDLKEGTIYRLSTSNNGKPGQDTFYIYGPEKQSGLSNSVVVLTPITDEQLGENVLIGAGKTPKIEDLPLNEATRQRIEVLSTEPRKPDVSPPPLEFTQLPIRERVVPGKVVADARSDAQKLAR